MYLQETLEGRNFPLAKLLHTGVFNDYHYAVSEKVKGAGINTLNERELKSVMPSIMEALTKLHSIDVIDSEGYGWLDSNRTCTIL